MSYEEYIGENCQSPDGRIYLFVLARNLRNDQDIKSLRYLKACVARYISSFEGVPALVAKIQELIDEIA